MAHQGYRVSKEDDARFEREYHLSMPAVDAVAEHLKCCGNSVSVICDRIYKDRWSYQDRQGDLRGVTPNGLPFTVEVKHRKNFSFTNQQSFPFSTLIVDRSNKAVSLCDLYFSVNSEITHAAVVSLCSKNKWVRCRVPDYKRGYDSVPVWECPKQYARFIRLARGDGE